MSLYPLSTRVVKTVSSYGVMLCVVNVDISAVVNEFRAVIVIEIAVEGTYESD